MKQRPKVFGVGMSKTGTTTLGACLEVLGFIPHVGFEPQLKVHYHRGGDIERLLRHADAYQSFEDSPWYHIYRELDQRYPGSKFVLTVRKDSLTHARSSWHHGVRRGLRIGEPSPAYLAEKIRIYEDHNRSVMDYFAGRPGDLLVLCWENGDGWDKLCGFLEVSVPCVPIPHRNAGSYRSRLPRGLTESRPYRAIVRVVHRLSLTSAFRRLHLMLAKPHAGDVSSNSVSR